MLAGLQAIATHNRAGEITYRHLEGLTFEFTITTYTYSLSPADRDFLEVSWDDGQVSMADRIEQIYLDDFYKKNTYVTTHTFPGPGVYEIVVEDPNRNFGVLNIPNSVNVVFAIKTTLQLGADLIENSSPVMLNAPIDKAALNRLFTHNPVAVDTVDGDSISYELTKCLADDGVEIADYSFPPYSNSFYVEEFNGDLVWDAPTVTGVYNVAMKIIEWRRIGGSLVVMSNIVRDMQIEVVETDNDPPLIKPVEPVCVEAGDTVYVLVSVSDPNGDDVNMEAIGIPLLVSDSPATFESTASTVDAHKYLFTWNTTCSHVHKYPYQVTFKATDEGTLANLVDLENLQITVIAPAPKNLTLTPSNKTMALTWSPNKCENATGYEIYRKEGSYGFVPDECETGVPAYTGYELVGTLDAWSDTVFVDDDGGAGLRQGIEYCYMVNAIFADGAKSYASEEVCGFLKNGIPIITNVDVITSSDTQGAINLAWSDPKELDTMSLNGPFHYLIYRSTGLWGENLVLIDSTLSRKDTTFTDMNLNTLDQPYSYKVELYHADPQDRFLIGAPQVASSQFLEIVATDNRLDLMINRNVPWIDSLFVIYRWDETLQDFDSIGISNLTNFSDDSLNNGTEYCYKVESIGYYNTKSVIHPLINYSQERCGIPVDTVPPCQPDLMVGSLCENFINKLAWTNPNNYCANDVVKYKIYYTGTYDGEWELLGTIDTTSVTTFDHDLFDIRSMAACYAVTAIDSFDNESPIVSRVCVDACFSYELPNVFTPNNDGINDFFVPVYIDPEYAPYYLVEKIDLKIFNRWGNLVFETEDPAINWDGTYLDTNEKLADGVYYYTCDVYSQRLSGLEHTTLVGFVQIFKDTEPASNPE